MSEINNWTENRRNRAEKGNYAKWPNEVMLKIVFGNYLNQSFDVQSDWSVLDVGTGFGSNLLPYLHEGCNCFGVEINERIADIAEEVLQDRGYDTDIRSGHNRDLPHDNNQFDLLLSVNVIHYEESKQDIQSAFEEYSRVLKPDGKLFLMTVGPNHEIYRRAVPVDNHLFEINDYGFRTGETMFFFDNEKYLDMYLGEYFDSVETGSVTENLMERNLNFLIGVGQNPY